MRDKFLEKKKYTLSQNAITINYDRIKNFLPVVESIYDERTKQTWFAYLK